MKTSKLQSKIQNWEARKLGQVTQIIMGQSPPSSTYNTEGSGLPFFQGKFEFGELYPTPTKFCKEPIRIASKDDVLISVRAPVGPVNLAPSKCCIGRGLSSIRASEDSLDQFFLFFYLKFYETRWLALGSTFAAIGRRNLENLKIPIPPIEIQHQIVERLDAIRKAQELNDKQIALADELFQSLLHRELDPKGKNWETRKLEEFAIFKRGPFGGSLKKEIFVETGYKVYEQKNVIHNDFSLGGYFITEGKYKEMTGFAVRPGDLIMSCSGTIGKVAIVPEDASPGIINQALLKVAPRSKFVLGSYLKLVIESRPIQNKIFTKIRGSAIRNVASVGEIKRIRIFLPTLETQRQIVQKLQAVQDYKKSLLTQKEKLKELFESTLDKAMTPQSHFAPTGQEGELGRFYNKQGERNGLL